MMESVRVQAPAKLNLGLDIVGRRPDGYHLLETVMLAIDLRDSLTLRRRADDRIAVRCDLPGMPDGADNLAHRAAEAFFARTGLPRFGLDIEIEKWIPIQGGLAGGSADAAGVLVGLNRLSGARLSGAVLEEIGLGLGADVPFCLRGGCALARGIGEELEPLPVPEGAWLAVAKPAEGMDTAEAFRRYDALSAAVSRPDRNALCVALAAGDLPALGAAMGNVLEAVCPVETVGWLKRGMHRCGALGAVMTGSGTAVAGLFDSQASAATCLEAIKPMTPELFLCRPLAHGAQIAER